MSDEVKKALPAIATAFAVLCGMVILAYLYSRPREGSIVLPGGITYLGPSPTQTPWATQTGKKFSYSFLYPSSLSLGVFPDDPFDAVTIFWQDTNPQENLLLRVETIPEPKQPKKDYVFSWWKQYNWKGVAGISEFTNGKGLKGYRAKYIDASGKSPYDQVFLEVPGRPELLIWLSGKMVGPAVFDKIVESVSWSP